MGSSQLAEILKRGLWNWKRNRATLEAARILVAYMSAVDKSGMALKYW
jgi:hypothetical protein